MRILIDNQYKTIYNGEFREYVETNIINRLNIQSNVIDLPKNFTDVTNLLGKNEYDLVIVTGYDAKILGVIDNKKYDTKVACVIYDMNAEQVLPQLNDNGVLSDIISFKSRLIFLSNFILYYNKTVYDQIIELYKNYKGIVSIKSKMVNIDFLYKIKIPNNKIKRILNKKYVLIPESINGLTFISSSFINLIDDIISNKDKIPLNFLFVIICKKFPEKFLYKIKNNNLTKNFKIFTDVDSITLNALYKQSIATLFVSPIDNNLTNLCNAIFNDSLCMINYKNQSMVDFVEDSSILTSFDDNNIFNDILEAIRLNSEIKKNIIKSQKVNVINKINKANAKLNINI